MNLVTKAVVIILLTSLSSLSYARKSSEIRKDHKFTSSLGVGYFYNKLTSSSEFGHFLDARNVLSFHFVSLETSNSEYDSDRGEDVIYDSGNGHAFELTLKSFESNSFYIKAGLYYRNQSSSERDIDDGGLFQFSNTIDAEGTVQDLGIIAAVGNQWQWSHFTMGCDWVGYSTSLKQWKYKNTGEGQAVFLNTVRLLHFYLGASF